MKATVKWWNDTKGYGYLTVGERDVFAHYTAIYGDGYKTLTEGEVVEVELVEGPKGPQAGRVVRNLAAPRS
jgi:CspA family cold shock protein